MEALSAAANGPHPVVATLLPLASFFLLILCFAIRSALRSSKEGTAGVQT